MHKPPLISILIAFSLVFLAILGWVFVNRLDFPMDVEWMEGGMLMHAVRLAEGKGIYGPPSAEFVPYFYTPGYPALVAILGKAFGITYGLGRLVSVLAWLGTAGLLFWSLKRESNWRFGVLGVGIYAALFRTNGAFYDVARPDSLFLLFVFAAMYVTRFKQSVQSACWTGVLCALGFLTKQTASVFFVAVCVVQFTRSWRHGLSCMSTGAGLAVIGCVCLNIWSDGWFWTYIFEGHQGHVFIWNNILLEYWRDLLFLAPILLLMPLIQFTHQVKYRVFSLILVGHWMYAFWVRMQSLDYSPHMYYRELWYESPRYLILIPPLLLAGCAAIILYRLRGVRFHTSWIWLWFFVAGCGVSGLNHSTQWAYSNCFMPVSIVASVLIALTVRDVLHSMDRWASWTCVTAVSIQFVALAYSPQAQVPSRGDWLAQAELMDRLSQRSGDTLIPSNPFLAYLASGTFHTHQMGLQDVAFLGGVKDLPKRIENRDYETVILAEGARLPGLSRHYYRAPLSLPQDPNALRMKTGYLTRLDSVWWPRYSAKVSPTEDVGLSGSRELDSEQWLAPGIAGTFELKSDFQGWQRKGKAFSGIASVPYFSYPAGRQGKYVLKSIRGAQGKMSIELLSQDKTKVVRGISFLMGGRCKHCAVKLVDDHGVIARAPLYGHQRILLRSELRLNRDAVGPLRLVLVDQDTQGVLVVDDMRLILARD